MTVLQAVSARFTSGKTPKAAFPSNTTAGSFLLAAIHFSNNNASVVTTDLTSENPLNASWGTPQTITAGGSAGNTLVVYTVFNAPSRITHDLVSGVTYSEVLTLNNGTFTNVFLVEMDDIEGADGTLWHAGSGSGTTISTPTTPLVQYGSIILGIHAHRNTDDQTPTAPAILLPGVTGAGPLVPTGMAANVAAISTALTFSQPGPVGSYAPATTIGTSRNIIGASLALKSFSGARPPFGVLSATSVMSAAAVPTLAGGNQQALVGFKSTYNWPALLTGAAQLLPTVTNLTSSNLTQTTADLSFVVNPGNLVTSLLVDYTASTDDAGDPIWASAATVIPAASPLAASLNPSTVTVSLTGLTDAATYYWRVEATNTQGPVTSDVATFTTASIATAAPVVTASSATSITETTATLVGTINPKNLASHYYFEYGTSSSLATFSSTTDTALSPVDDSAHTVSANITGLTASTTYYFRLHGYNSDQPESAGGADSSIVSFSTPAPAATVPVVTVADPTTDKATSMVVSGTVDPGGASTTWRAQVSTDNFSTVAVQTSAVTLSDSTAGNAQTVSAAVTGLTAATSYKTRIAATNTVGTTNGTASAALSTESLPAPSNVASSHAATTATISMDVGHATMTSAVDWSFEYGTTNAYGTAGASGTVAASDADPTNVSSDLTGLSASTTYHWRGNVVRHDGDGATIHTGDQTFTTSAAPTTVGITTPTAYGPSSAISTTLSAGVPAYTILVASDGTLKRSDTSAGITIAGTEFTGAGTITIASDSAGTIRTPASGVLDQIRFLGPAVIFREINGTTSMGQFESSNCNNPSGSPAVWLQGCTGTWQHWRSVWADGIAVRISRSFGSVATPSGAQGTTWQTWVNATPAPDLIVQNFTAQVKDTNASAALQIDGGRNIRIGGFDSGYLSTKTVGGAAAGVAVHAVWMDAALHGSAVKTDLQDVYIDKAADGTDSYLTARTGKYALRLGLFTRCGVRNALSPNTSGSRPDRPIWFNLANGTAPGSETAGNCTNDQVISENFVNQDWFAVNTVNATFRDGSTKAQQYEVRSEVFDPAVALTLWTPADVIDSWPNGHRRFIATHSLKRGLGPRPTLAATRPGGGSNPVQNKSQIDSTWTHMGGTAPDGFVEIKDVIFDPATMVDGADGTAGTKLYSNTVKKGAQVTVSTATTVNTTTATTLPVTGTLTGYAVNADPTLMWGLYTSYFDATKPNEVETGVPYRRQLSFTGISGGSFTGVKLIPGPTGISAAVGSQALNPTTTIDIIKITAGVVESFFPHGLPTGDSVTVGGVTGLSGPYVVTRIDAYTFSLAGQGAFSWTPTAGTVGTVTPTTTHTCALLGSQTSITLPVGTTIDDAQNENYGQPVNNVTLQITGKVRFIRCTFNDINVSALNATSTIELVDCDHSVTALPGSYDYDSIGNLGVPGTYDRFNQHLPSRMLTSLNVISATESVWTMRRFVHTGAHGDVLPGRYKLGSRADELYVEQGSPSGTNNDGSAQSRPGIGSGLPKVLHSAHGDIAQWYDRRTFVFSRSTLITMAHAPIFSRLGTNWEAHTATTLSKDVTTGFYKVTLAAGDNKHNLATGDTCRIKTGGPLLGLEFPVIYVNNTNFILDGAVYPATGAQTTADVVKSIHLVVPGFLRSVTNVQKYVNTADRTRSGPVMDKGNVSISITTSIGSSPPTVIPGEIDYLVTIHDSCIDNGGAFALSDPVTHTEWVDLGTPNRNAFTTFKGTGIPGAAATPTYTTN